MEINYNTIINVLCPLEFNRNSHYNKSNQKDGNTLLEFLNSLSNDTDESFLINNFNLPNNISSKFRNPSLISSVLSIIDDKMVQLDEHEKSIYIDNFIKHLKEKAIDTKFKLELKLKFNRNIFYERISNYDYKDGLIYQLLVQILNINIFTFEKDDESNNFNIKTLFYGDNMDPWKPIILLYKVDDNFYPISLKESKLFSYNNLFIKELLNKKYSSIKYFNSEYLDKEFSITDNIKEIVNEYVNKLNLPNFENKEEEENIKYDKEDESESNSKLLDDESEISISSNEISNESSTKIFIKDKNNLTSYNKTTLKNMKKNDIFNILKENSNLMNLSDSDFSLLNKLTKPKLIDEFLRVQNSI